MQKNSLTTKDATFFPEVTKDVTFFIEVTKDAKLFFTEISPKMQKKMRNFIF